jgi:hypothetical protein
MGLASKLKNGTTAPVQEKEYTRPLTSTQMTPLQESSAIVSKYQSLQRKPTYMSLEPHKNDMILGLNSTQVSDTLPESNQSILLNSPTMLQQNSVPKKTIDAAFVKEFISKMISTNKLEKFYDENSIKRVLEKINAVDFAALADQWKIPVEIAFELSTLALYDIAVFADDSGSMRFEDNGARIGELARILARIAQITTLFDDDGILIRFFNSNAEGNGITDASSADELLTKVPFAGMTPMGSKLEEKILMPFVYESCRQGSFRKPVLVYVITDGEPMGEPPSKIFDVVARCKNYMSQNGYGKGVAFEFAQVGRDQAAQKFLGRLDNDTLIGDIVDTTSYYEMEAEEYREKGIELTPELWTLKLMLGAVDPTYDEQD